MNEEFEALKKELADIRAQLATQSPTNDEDRLTKAIEAIIAKDDGAHGGVGRQVAEVAADEVDTRATVRDLVETKAATDEQRELQNLNDAVYLATAMGRAANREFDPRGMKCYGRLQLAVKAMSTSGSSTGADFVPTTMSNQLREEIRLLRQVPALFDGITIPRSPHRWPVEGAIGLPYIVGEPTVDTAEKIPTRTPATSYVEFDAKTFAVRVPFSLEFDEDSIVGAMDYVRRAVAKSIVDGTETAILNGDTTATHRDTVVTAANDVRHLWDGLRELTYMSTVTTFDTAETSIGTAAWEETDVAAIRAKLSPQYFRSDELVLITGPKAYSKALVNAAKSTSLWPNYIAMDKIGNRAINVTGEVGSVFNIPWVVSAYCPETTDSSGYDTGGGTTGVCVIANRRAFALATQRAATIETVWDAEALQYRVICHTRMDFKPWATQGSTTNRAVAIGIKIAI